jgi:hypothetical protein
VSRVNVEGASLRDKARFLAEHFTNLTVITVDGQLLRYKLPGESWGVSSWADGLKRREKTVEDLLNELEPLMRGAPVAILGYSQMIRGDSFRSDWRVPTHILQQLSNAMSVGAFFFFFFFFLARPHTHSSAAQQRHVGWCLVFLCFSFFWRVPTHILQQLSKAMSVGAFFLLLLARPIYIYGYVHTWTGWC